jgi:murein DD-endopeptidase MepM/ murein hydrolase activator NlpD
MEKIGLKLWKWFLTKSIKVKTGIIAGLMVSFFVFRKYLRDRAALASATQPTKQFPFTPILLPKQMLRNDSTGSGYFGASRDGGKKNHEGIDIIVYESQPIYSPFNGILTRQYYAYSSDTKYLGLEVVSSINDFKIKIMYCKAIFTKLGKYVKAGEMIGYAQKISSKYTPLMKDHVHVELYQFGSIIDPTLHIQLTN